MNLLHRAFRKSIQVFGKHGAVDLQITDPSGALYSMLEKIGTEKYKYISTADSTVLKYLALLSSKDIVYYEIGIGVGATTLQVSKYLDNSGKIIIFSHANDVRELTSDLLKMGFHNIDGTWGSPNKIYSGYHFQLAMAFSEGRLPQFDLAYIDGGHVFHLDAPAACILKELCKPGGYMLFDDWVWRIADSPTVKPSVNPKTLDLYDEEQINTAHVQLVCKTIMDTDKRFKFLGVEKDTAVYRRL